MGEMTMTNKCEHCDVITNTDDCATCPDNVDLIDGCGEIMYDAQFVALRTPSGETYGIELDTGVIIGNVNTWRDVLRYIAQWDVQRVVVYHDNILQYYINVNAPQPPPVQLTAGG